MTRRATYAVWDEKDGVWVPVSPPYPKDTWMVALFWDDECERHEKTRT